MRYTLHRLTGSRLTDGTPESAGIISRHRTETSAERAADSYRRACPLGARVEVREVRPAHRPRRDPGAARVMLALRVHPETRARLAAESQRTDESQGQVIDRLVQGLG
jgi:hypothetical protein